MDEQNVPVLIVGAGLAGLSTAMFLGLHGVRALVVERHASTSVHPKARGQFPHVMEALRVAGVDRKMIKASTEGNGFRIVIADSLAGPVFKEILVGTTPDFTHLSTAGWADASQERAEPILAQRARELGAEIRFNTAMESFHQDSGVDGGVTAVLRDLTTGETTTVRAGYLVAADGVHGTIRSALGIGVHGRGTLSEGIGVVFEADLAGVLEGSRVLCHLRNPALPGGGGTLVSTDEPDRYAFGVGFDSATDRIEDFPQARWTDLIRAATGVPDLAPKLVAGGQGTTRLEHRVADRFSAGRVHLVGDAAKVMPPTGAFGGNTAIMDGFCLAWKLAMVVRGEAGAGLLDSHDPERRCYADIIAEQQYTAFVERMRPDLADGTVAAPLAPVSVPFFGYRAISDAVVLEPDDDRSPLENPEQPTGRPGSRAPHVPLLRDGVAVSPVELFGRSFVLLAGSEGEPWLAAAASVAGKLGIPLAAYRIVPGRGGGTSLGDPERRWARTYGVTDGGAVLVRPDFFVAWRCRGDDCPGTNAADALERALRAVLHRPTG